MSERPEPADDEEATDGRLAELRSLLLQPERERLGALEQQIARTTVSVDEISRLLPAAVSRRPRGDEELGDALPPAVERALTSSVRDDRQRLSEILYPIMGPAIRQSLAAALRGMADSLNQLLDSSFSRRALAWRWEAWTTGRKFGEVVLLHSLQYRVEQLFLIERETSLPLAHTVADVSEARDGDVVSAMLSAVQDFVRDSFADDKSDTLDTFETRDKTVWIEHGPRALLAAVIRGSPPEALRRTLRNTLEQVHATYHEALGEFDGDATSFESAVELLEPCLHVVYRPAEKRPVWPGLLVLGLLLTGLLTLGGWSWLDARRQQAHLDAFVDWLRDEPGIVVTEVTRRGDLDLVAGLRDPLAPPPREFLTPRLEDTVETRFTAYHALDPAIVLRRAEQALAPPAGVRLSLDGATLVADGAATARWREEARRRALAGISGVDHFDDGSSGDRDALAADSAVGDDDLRARQALRAARANLERHIVGFGRSGAGLGPTQTDDLRTIAADLRRVAAAAREAGVALQVEVVGHTDAVGSTTANRELSQARADAVIAALTALDTGGAALRARGAGATEPLVEERSQAERQRNRRVSFRVEIRERGR